jgi:tetratricopeptide (TPR) repeat protein
MTDRDNNPLVKMITEVRTKIRRDLYSGELDFDVARSTLRKYIDIAQQMDDKILAGQLHESLGTIELELGNYDEGLALYQQSHDCFKEVDDIGRMGVMLSNIGEIYRRQGRNDEAAAHFTQARQMAITAKREMLVITTYNNEGQVWIAAGDLERGIGLIETGLEKAHEADWNREVASDAIPEMRSSLAQAYAQLGDFKAAWHNVKMGFNLAKEYNQLQQMAYGYLTMAIIAQLDPDSEEDPVEYFRLSREHYEKIQANAALGQMLVYEGEYWENKGHTANAHKVYREALPLLEKSRLISDVEKVRQRLSLSK